MKLLGFDCCLIHPSCWGSRHAWPQSAPKGVLRRRLGASTRSKDKRACQYPPTDSRAEASPAFYKIPDGTGQSHLTFRVWHLRVHCDVMSKETGSQISLSEGMKNKLSILSCRPQLSEEAAHAGAEVFVVL